MGADWWTSCSCHPDNSCMLATGNTSTDRIRMGSTTTGSMRSPSTVPSGAIRSRSPNLPSPSRSLLDNNPSHRPNRSQANRLSSQSLRGSRLRNRPCLLMRHCLLSQRLANRQRNPGVASYEGGAPGTCGTASFIGPRGTGGVAERMPLAIVDGGTNILSTAIERTTF